MTTVYITMNVWFIQRIDFFEFSLLNEFDKKKHRFFWKC